MLHDVAPRWCSSAPRRRKAAASVTRCLLAAVSDGTSQLPSRAHPLYRSCPPAGNPIHGSGGREHARQNRAAAVGTYAVDLAAPEPTHDRGKFVQLSQHQPDGSGLINDDIFNLSLPVPA